MTQLSPLTALFFDARTQIIDNCEFLIKKDDIVQVVTSKDPTGNLFKAYAVRSSGENRQAILASKPCESAEKAVESLHTKSCEAVHNHVNAKGFSAPRDPKIVFPELGADDGDNASVISDHSEMSVGTFSEGCSSAGDEETLRHAPSNKAVPKDEPQTALYPPASAYPRRPAGPPAAVQDFPDYVNSASRVGPPPGSRPPPPPGHPFWNGPPQVLPQGNSMPPHPGPLGMMAGPHPPRPQNGINPPLPPLNPFRAQASASDIPPFPIRQGPPKPPQQTHIVRIAVNWLRHGQHRIVTQCQHTREALQNAALNDVRANRSAFTGGRGDASLPTAPLRAHVRQAVFAGETYDMRSFHEQDLARLFGAMAAADDIPLFEVVVEDVEDETWGRHWRD